MNHLEKKECPSCLAGFSKEDVMGNCTCDVDDDPTPYSVLRGKIREELCCGCEKQVKGIMTAIDEYRESVAREVEKGKVRIPSGATDDVYNLAIRDAASIIRRT